MPKTRPQLDLQYTLFFPLHPSLVCCSCNTFQSKLVAVPHSALTSIAVKVLTLRGFLRSLKADHSHCSGHLYFRLKNFFPRQKNVRKGRLTQQLLLLQYSQRAVTLLQHLMKEKLFKHAEVKMSI